MLGGKSTDEVGMQNNIVIVEVESNAIGIDLNMIGWLGAVAVKMVLGRKINKECKIRNKFTEK